MKWQNDISALGRQQCFPRHIVSHEWGIKIRRVAFMRLLLFLHNQFQVLTSLPYSQTIIWKSKYFFFFFLILARLLFQNHTIVGNIWRWQMQLSRVSSFTPTRHSYTYSAYSQTPLPFWKSILISTLGSTIH